MTMRDVIGGIGVAGGALLRSMRLGRPERLTLAERLAMLPCSGLPVAEPVHIRWNENQIPFIEAASDADLAVALGAVHAHLRLGQMEMLRRLATGRMAETIGRSGIEMDIANRMIDVGRAVPEILAARSPRERAWSQGFVDGINHHLERAAKLPLEYRVLDLPAEPWTIEDLYRIARFTSADISWVVWMQLLPLRARLSRPQWSALWPALLRAGATPMTAQGSDTGSIARHLRAFTAHSRHGSNSVAVAGARSASGHAMIASDPHLPISWPCAFFIVGLRSPQTHCVGLTMAGLPVLALGRNRQIAWGGTNLHAQASDLVDVSDLPESAFSYRSETILIRGETSRTIRFRDCAHGPVLQTGGMLPVDRPVALRWVGHTPSHEIDAMLGLAKARDTAEFLAALRGYAVPAMAMVCAGPSGAVSRHCAAHLPARTAAPPADILTPLADAADWQTMIDIDGLPATDGNATGFVVSGNESPPGKPCATVGYFFAPPHRAARMTELLSQPPAIDMRQLQALQTDVLSHASLALRDRLVAALPPALPTRGQRALAAALRGWDGCYSAQSDGALAFELLLGLTARRLGLMRTLPAFQAIWASQALLALLLQQAGATATRRAMRAALPGAALRLRRHRTWGGMHRIVLQHTLARLPTLKRRLTQPGFAAPGGNDTVHKSSHDASSTSQVAGYGSCARHVSDLASLDSNGFVLLGGQDGWIGSDTSLDQVEIWRRGACIQVPLSETGLRDGFPFTTTLFPSAPFPDAKQQVA